MFEKSAENDGEFIKNQSEAAEVQAQGSGKMCCVLMLLGGLLTSKTPLEMMRSYLGRRQGASVPAGVSALP